MSNRTRSGCWMACKTVHKPVTGAELLEEPSLVWDLDVVSLCYLESMCFSSWWFWNQYTNWSCLVFYAKNSLAYVNVSSCVDGAISNITSWPYYVRNVLLFINSAQLLPFTLSLCIIYNWCQASLVSAELLLQQADIFNDSNVIFLNTFLMLKSYIGFS